MNSESLAVAILLVAAFGVLVYASTGESYHHPIPQTVTVIVPFSVP